MNATEEESNVPENVFEENNEDSEEDSDVDIVVVNRHFSLSSIMEDIESMGTKNGVHAHEYSIGTTKGKPWLKPGADINDYCSYGFNESTWLAYYEHQKKKRCNESLKNGDSYKKLRPDLARNEEYYVSRFKKETEDRAYEREREGRNRYRDGEPDRDRERSRYRERGVESPEKTNKEARKYKHKSHRHRSRSTHDKRSRKQISK
ncbi:uncharacterized protein LOC112686033 [Sipha flava]|jgi:pre-mRNA 3'-end-processing factor FIP1|uniref:Uncharacterized protein LOC112686033 n=1 Tax=Sipha flava TaxID=143950 RepID=A0A8B8FU92_9HEMI|nr:uncharacterized protein LOC112686033 [Sipha flava]